MTLRGGKYWLPVFLWMAMIFAASTDLGSTRQTSRIIGPLLRFFWPEVSEETIASVQLIVRKGGHVTGYAILAILIWRARQQGIFANGWNLKAAQFAVGLATIYAVTDEIHQSMVPTRMGSPWDVLIDAIGATVGVGVIWAIGKWRRKW